jgi:hypothetical protein
MRKKSIAIWFLTSITFISLVHLIEAITVIMFNNPIRLLQLYPFANTLLKALTPYSYLYVSAGITAIIWAITCLVAFNNPVELYVNKREQTDAILQDRDVLLDRMCETVESDHQVLTRLTDSIRRMQKGMNDEEISPAVPSFPKETVTLKSKPFPTKGFPSKFAAQSAKTTKPQKTGLVHAKQKITSRKNGNQKAMISASGANIPMS